MEDFSQSRGDDDLFDDEIIPLDPSEIEEVTVQTQDLPRQSPPTFAPTGPSQRGYGPRGRGRGAGGRGRGSNELLNSRYAPKASPPQAAPQPEAQLQQQPSVPEAAKEEATSATQPEVQTKDDTTNPKAVEPESAQAATATPSTPARTQAVRGDRTATGGIKKPKLTEDELTAKLAEAKERSQNLSAAHARAQADAASFEEREKIAHAKRAKDAVNRKAMETERAQNRQRKMAGQGGREWDMEKEGDEFRGRGRGAGFTRGAHSGVRYDRESRDPASSEGQDVDLRQYQWNEKSQRAANSDTYRNRGPGRGGRGRARGGDRDKDDARDGNAPGRRQPDVSAEAEFPALPERAKPTDDAKEPGTPAQARTTSRDVLSPSRGKETWADQVEGEVAKQT